MEFQHFVEAVKDAAQSDDGFYINPGKEPTYEFERWRDSIVVVFDYHLVLMVLDTNNPRVPVIYLIATPKTLEKLDGKLVFDVTENRLDTSLEGIWASNARPVGDTTIPTRESFKNIARGIMAKFDSRNHPTYSRAGVVQDVIFTFSPCEEEIAKTDVYVAYYVPKGNSDEKHYLKRLIESHPKINGLPTVTYSWTTNIREAFRFDLLYSTTTISNLIHHICGPRFGGVGIASIHDTNKE